MSQFEFITIAISIVMALGVSRLLDVLAPSLRPPRRSWIHVGWVVQRLLTHVIWWWGIWFLRDTAWTLPLFAFQLVGPVILYLQATALATPSSDAPMSWESRFFEIRVPFFLGNIALVLLSLATSSLYPTGPGTPVTPVLAPLLILGALHAAGIATRDPRAHLVIVALALVVQLLGLGSAVVNLVTPT